MVITEQLHDTITLADTNKEVIRKLEGLLDTVGVAAGKVNGSIPTVILTDTVGVVEGQGTAVYKRTYRTARATYNFPTTISGYPVRLKTLQVTRRLSQTSTLKAEVVTADLPPITLGGMIRVDWVSEDGTIIPVFVGVVTEVGTTSKTDYSTITADGLEQLLAKDVYMLVDTAAGTVQGVFEYINERADVIAAAILEGTAFTLIECPDTPVTVKFDFTPRWRALGLLADILGQDLWVDDSMGVHIGQKRGSVDLFDAIIRTTSTADVKNKVNRVVIIGGTQPDGRVPIGVVQDGGDIASSYPRTFVKKFPQIQDADTAKMLAKVYLDRFSKETREVNLLLSLTSVNVRLREGDVITVDGGEYKVSKLTLMPDHITVTATPTVAVPDLTSYLRNAITDANFNDISSDFESSAATTFVIYENLTLSPDPDADGTPEAVLINNVTYTVIGVMSFYVPDTFTPDNVAVHARQYSAEDTGTISLYVNGVGIPFTVTTGADGKKEYEAVIPAEVIRAGWNYLYILDGDVGTGGDG